MFTALVRASLRQRIFVIATALMMLCYGLWQAPRLPVDVFPDLNKPVITVLTEAGGMAPEEVEQLVTFPLETALVQAAQQRGCRVANGGGMAVFQAVGAFSLFTGLQPDAKRMLAHFQELTGSTVNDLARRA